MDVHDLPPYTYRWKKCDESEGFEAGCVEVPDLSAYGDTPEEALHEIRIAVCAWLEVLKEDGLPFPASQNQQQPIAESGQSMATHRVPRTARTQ